MKTNTTLSIALAALFSSSLAFADTEVTGKMTIEHAALTSQDAFTALKDDISIRLYADGDVMDGVTYHAELQGTSDGTKVGGYYGEYTQNAAIRELYTDIDAGNGWAARLGKQQIVWGTADGMKLLDIINPTDYAEMAQNQMEDSRIPVWALNLEAGSVQMVISEPKENVFAGLNRGTATGKRQNSTIDLTTPTGTGPGTDTGNAFLMMGPDSITGEVNGFLNIVPDLASVAAGFSGAFGQGNYGSGGLLDYKHFTVNTFAGMTAAQVAAGMSGVTALGPAISMGLDGAEILANFGSSYNTNLTSTTGWDEFVASGYTSGQNTGHLDFGVVKDSAFEYMGNATFATFDAFAGASSEYRYNMPSSEDVDFAIKTSQTTKSGVNYSLNFSNSYDKNPIIDISWKGENDVEIFTIAELNWFVTDENTGVTTPSTEGATGAWSATSLTLNDAADGSGVAYGSNAMVNASGVSTSAFAATAANLVFEQSVVKTKNLGGSFDTTIETAGLGPVVIRGEVLYTQDSKQPVIDKALFAIGDLPGALTMQDADRFKFVLGADITVLTNMLISAQYISDRNLDFVDGNTDTGIYSADYATMHLSNGFNKAIEDKQFLSLFLSKPFGKSGEHRWNNIVMVEEGVDEDAYWNRFDVNYGLADDVEGTVEFNNYWGNANTQFGQLKDASNMQVGVKYSF